MKKIKIIIPVFILAIISTSIYLINSNTSYNKVRPEDKILYSDSLMMSTCPASLETGYNMSDIVIRGKILDIYQEDVDFIIPISDKLGKDIPKLTCTYYSVEVEDIYLGEIATDIITYREVGDFNELCTKPKEKTEVILMLNERTDVDSNKKVYVSTMQEHSIITIDSNGKMYSFSNTEELSKFDGRPWPDFNKEFEAIKKKHNYRQNKIVALEHS